MAQLGSSKVYGDLYVSGKTTISPTSVSDGLLYSVNSAVAAAGTTQATATLLYRDINVVTSSTAGSATGVILPVATIGRNITVFNNSANAITVYPATGGYIDTGAINVGKTVMAGGSIKIYAFNTTNWESTLDMVMDATKLSGIVPVSGGGTGQSSVTAAFNALSPSTTLGDLIYNDGTNDVRLAGNTTSKKKFLIQTGTGSVSAAPTWGGVVAADISDATTAANNNTIALRDASGGITATKYIVQSWSMLQDVTSGSLKFMFG